MDSIISNLNIIGACGATQLHHRAKKYFKALELLRTELTAREVLKIEVARSHYIIGEGGVELMDIVKELKDKYSK